MDIRIIIKLHELLKAERTGNPKELSYKLGISERTVFNYISFMKNDLYAPIGYCKTKRSYEYKSECVFKFENK